MCLKPEEPQGTRGGCLEEAAYLVVVAHLHPMPAPVTHAARDLRRHRGRGLACGAGGGPERGDVNRPPRQKVLLTVRTRVLPSNRENVFSGFVNIFTLQRAQGFPSLWTCELWLWRYRQRCSEHLVRSGTPPTTRRTDSQTQSQGSARETALLQDGEASRHEAPGMRPEGGSLPRGSPAEKVSCTCSSTTSRAMKSCFSLKRPLYSSSAFLSWVANLGGRAQRSVSDPRVQGLQVAGGGGAQGDRPSQSGRQHRPRSAKTLVPGTLSLSYQKLRVQVVLAVKNPPANARDPEMQVRSLSQEDPLEEGMATHSGILAWRVPWTEEPGALKSMGLQSWTRLSIHIAQNLISYVPFWKEQSSFSGELGCHNLRMMPLKDDALYQRGMLGMSGHGTQAGRLLLGGQTRMCPQGTGCRCQ